MRNTKILLTMQMTARMLFKDSKISKEMIDELYYTLKAYKLIDNELQELYNSYLSKHMNRSKSKHNGYIKPTKKVSRARPRNLSARDSAISQDS